MHNNNITIIIIIIGFSISTSKIKFGNQAFFFKVEKLVLEKDNLIEEMIQ